MSGVQFNLPFTLGIGDTPPAGLDPKVTGLAEEIYNAFTQIQLALHNTLGVGQQLKTQWSALDYTSTLHNASQTRYYRIASENLIYGAAINIWSDAGTLKFRNANATDNTKPCHGFCTTLGGVTAGDYCEAILFQGLLTGFAGLTAGARYFLSTANGLIAAAAPVAAGNIEQALGIALSSSALLYQFDLHFIQH